MPIGIRNLIANLLVAAVVYLVARFDERVAIALVAYLVLVARDLIDRRFEGR